MAIILDKTEQEPDPQFVVLDDSINGGSIATETHVDATLLVVITLGIFVVAILARPLLGIFTFFLKYLILLGIIFFLVSYFGILQ